MIAFEAASSGSAHALTLSVSHTITVANTILICSYGQRTNPTTLTSIQFNGVDLTLYDSQYPVVGYQAIYYMLNPPVGTFNLESITSSTTDQVQANASYTGVLQTSPVDVGDKTTSGSSAGLSQSLTTTVDNDWIFASGIDNTQSQSASAGSTQRATVALNIVSGIYDNNTSLTPAGTYSIGFDMAGAQSCGIIAFALKPAPSAFKPKIITVI